jgi:hypothetical protein
VTGGEGVAVEELLLMRSQPYYQVHSKSAAGQVDRYSITIARVNEDRLRCLHRETQRALHLIRN